MKHCNTRNLLPIALPGILCCLALLLCGCTAQPDQGPANVPSQGAQGADDPKPALPQDELPATPGMPQMPLPSVLDRQTSTLPRRLFLHGAFNTGLMPSQRVDNEDGKQLSEDNLKSFEPDFVPGDAVQFSGLSFAGYDMRPGAEFSGPRTLTFGWYRTPLNPANDFWIGLADFSRDSWIWMPGPLPGQSLDLSGIWDRIVSPQGYIFVEVLFTGNDAPTLHWLLLGEPWVEAKLMADPVIANSELTTTLAAVAWPSGCEVVGYDFDFEGDGVYDILGDEYSVEHTYSELGTYHPVARVRLDNSTSVETSIELTVADPNNVGPTAILHVEPDSGDAPLTVMLDASASEDGDEGQITSCEWDLDGDGIYELNTGDSLITTVTLCNHGLNTVKVRVTDNDKDSSVTTANINLDSGWRHTLLEGTSGTSMLINMELIGPELAQVPGIVYRGTDGLYFMAAQTNLAVEWASPKVIAPDLPVKSNPVLANIGGRPCVAFSVGSSPLDDAYFARPFDEYGGLWGGAVLAMDSAGSWLDLAEVEGFPAIASVVNSAKHLHYARALNAEGSAWPAPQLVSPLGGAAAQSSPLLEVRPGLPPRIFFGRRNWFHEYGTFLVTALDPLGNAFGEPEQVSDAFPGRMDHVRFGNRSRLLIYENWDISGMHYVCEESDDAGWQRTQVVDANLYSGRDLAMLIHEGRPLIFYTLELTGRTGLRMRHADDSLGDDWGPEMVIDPSQLAGSKLAAVTSVGRPMIVWSDLTADKLHFASFH